MKGELLVAASWLSLPAYAGDLPAKAKELIDAGEMETARKKCTAWGATDPTAEKGLREMCAQVWLTDAERTDTIDAWAAFRAAWGDTTWIREATKREAELALSALGYDATEAQYLAIRAKYPDTEAAKIAYEHASQAAVRAIVGPADVRMVAKHYPEQVPYLLATHLQGFVTATVTANAVTNVVVNPPVLAPSDVRASWVVENPGGTYTPWEQVVRERLASYGLPTDAIAARLTTGSKPAFPICVDPGFGSPIGALLEAAGGRVFFAAPWDDDCGPNADPWWAAIRDGHIAEVSLKGAYFRLWEGDGTWLDIHALLPATGDPLWLGDRVVTPSSAAFIVQKSGLGLLGPEAWAEAGSIPAGIPLTLALTTPPPEGRPGPVFSTSLEPRVFAPLVQRFLSLGWPEEVTAPVEQATPPPTPPVPVPLEKADAKALNDALIALGLDPVALAVAQPVQIDLDGDTVPEVVAEGISGGRPIVLLWQPSSARVWAWVSRDVLPQRKPQAFSTDGKTFLFWAEKPPTTPIDRLDWLDVGPRLQRVE